MFTAQFYTFNKRANSTKRPEGSGRSYDITLKTDCSLTDPDIILFFGTDYLPEYNYVYIPRLKRYYFITEWEYVEHKNWVAHCQEDVLASWKTDIGLQSLYVVRSASRRDQNIIDMLYPAKADATCSSSIMTSPWMYNGNVTVNRGCFIVGCDSENGRFGSVNYYVLTPTQLSQLCTYLTTKFVSESKQFSISDASIALQNSLVNPMQFIRSCMWYPFQYSALSGLVSVEAVKVYNQTITYNSGGTDYTLTAGALVNAALYQPSSISLTKINHPQAADHGAYMNCSPFTDVQLKIPPLGVVNLDATLLANSSNPFIDHIVDLITGKVIMEVKTGTVTLHRLSTQLGVPIQLSQVTRDYQGVVNNAIGAVGKLFTGNVLGAANGVFNALSSAAPRVSSVGSNGGFADIYGDIELMYTFYTQTEVNNAEHGRPLMQTVQIGTLTGYIEVETPDIQIACLAQEADRIAAFLVNGFFYE